MRRPRMMLAIMAVAILGGIVPARGAPWGVMRFSFCTGDGYLQIFDNGPVGDDIYLNGHVGCIREPGSWAHPVEIETVIGASSVGTAGACGPTGVEGPLERLRMTVKMTLTFAGKTYTAVRTWTGRSTGNFPGTDINGQVRDPAGAVALGRFRLEPLDSFYCARDLSYIRLWDVVFIGPSPGA